MVFLMHGMTPYINIIQKSRLAKVFRFKNKILFGFGQTGKTLPSADTLVKPSEKRGPKTVPVPILKIVQK